MKEVGDTVGPADVLEFSFASRIKGYVQDTFCPYLLTSRYYYNLNFKYVHIHY